MLKLISLLLFIICWSNIAFTAKYYVNDNSTTGDVFCSAVGSNTTGNGTSSAPYATFNKLWNVRTGTFSHGDTIFVDAGTYSSYSGGDGFGLNCGYTIQVRLHIKGAGQSKTIFDNQFFTSSNVKNGGSSTAVLNTYYFAQITGGAAGATINDIQFKKYQYKTNFTGQVFTINSLTTSTTNKVKFNNVVFSENGATGSGASGNSAVLLIYTFDQTNKVEINGGGFFCNGSSTQYGGCIDILGGGASANLKLSISNVAFAGNQKNDSQYDGGVVINTSGSFGTDSLNISNCLIDGNNLGFASNNCSSAIYMTTSAGTPKVTITNSIFKNNTISSSPTAGYGGCCYFVNGVISISGCSFQNNSFSLGTVKGTLASNTATLTISNSSFSGNTANTAKDIHMQGAGTVSVSNSTFSSSATNLSRVAGTFTVTNSGTPSSTGTITISGTAPSTFSSPSVPTYSGTCSSLNIVLPIELLSFEARKIENYNLITWKTAAEIENDFFTVFKSNDGHNFEVLGYVKGAGNTTIENSYSLEDRDRVEGIVYYQLKQTNYNGESQFSDLISLDNTLNTKLHLLKITNLLGQEVSENESGILIYHFSDGSNLKRFYH